MQINKMTKQLLYAFLTFIMCVGASINASAQSNEVKVSGVVMDEPYDDVFIGVTIRGVGTTIGTTSDANGRFSITVPRGTVLRFSYIGYKTQQYRVTESMSDLTITMQEDAQKLSEVVVIGYGTSRKEDLSTSVATINLDKNLKSGPSNLGSMLQGRLPGVTIMNNGGNPLAGSSLNIRGKGSRGGDQVLYVVDGVPGAPFNTEDVENITILKDAASAAIYGASVGSGGVIVVTTKQAKEGKIKIDVNSSFSVKNVANLPKVTSAADYQKVWQEAAKDEGVQLPAVADSQKYPFGAIDRTNWLDEIFRTGTLQHYAITLSGGSEKLKAIASFAYDQNEGILLNTYRKGASGRFNIDYNINKWVNFNQNLNVSYSNGQGNVNTYSHEGVILNAVFYPTSATIYEQDEKGNILLNADGSQMFGGTIPRQYVSQGISGFGEIRNPVATLLRLREYRPSFGVFSTSGITLFPLRGLTLKSTFSMGQNWSRDEGFSVKVLEPGRPSSINERTIGNALSSRWIWETTATYAALFADVHHLSLMGGYTMSRSNYRSNWSNAKGFASEDPHLNIFGAAEDFDKPEEAISDESMISAFARASYSFADRYFLTASVRNDLSSKLHPDNRSAVFPAFSASWKISSESFLQDYKDVLNLLKVRGSWGQVGSVESVNPYAYSIPMSEARKSVFGKNPRITNGSFQRSISNPDLKWETTESWGVGLDLSLFNSFSMSVDYYNKYTRDLIEQMPILSTQGVEIEPLGNVGSVVNKGWEFTANYDKRIGDVTFGLFGNLSTLKSEVLSLGERDYIQDSSVINSMRPLRSAVGQPWQSFYLYQTDGIFRSEAEILAYKHTDQETGIESVIQPKALPGDLKFVDQNNDGLINEEDLTYMGSYLPKLTYAFGGNLEYSGLDFSFMFQGVAGNKIFNGFRMMGLTGRGQGNNLLADVMDSYNFNPNGNVPRIGVAIDPNRNFTSTNDYFLEDGSYLRLKNITLGYTLPKSVMKSIGLADSSLRIYASGENLWTITKYSGLDPEVGGVGIDGGQYPVSRNFTFGLNINF